MIILGIESSCDETAAAVLADGSELLSNIIHSQVDVHKVYGGVVPELASRQHIDNICPVVDRALAGAGITLDAIDAIAVTQGPGLIGSLLVGFCFAKALALPRNIPYIGVDHIAGHLLSVFLGHDRPAFPFVALIASGGHSSIFLVQDYTTFRLLGKTRDDAAGEAFDKVAKVLGLPYPGGPVISDLAAGGRTNAIPMPRAWLEPGSLDFSFSGIKTAVAQYVREVRRRSEEVDIPDLCASFQEAIVDVLVTKTLRAGQREKVSSLVLAGGVAANPRLREVMTESGSKAGFQVAIPPPEFCTDNAAMIALAGYHLYQQKATSDLDSDVYSRSLFLMARSG